MITHFLIYFELNDHCRVLTKINGHRIELGDISTMKSHSSVNRSVVTTCKKDINSNTILVAYYTDNNDNTIIEYLRSQLPPNMVPNFTIWIPHFPEILNGKIDMNKLL